VLIELLLVSAAAADFSSFERSVTEQMKRQGIPGVAIAVRAPDGSLAYSKGFGVTSADDPAAPAVTPTTLFRLGSTAKLATAAAIRKAGLDLAKPISNWAPDLPPALAQLTLGQLLTHTSGLRDDAPMDGPHDDAALAANVHSWQPKNVLMAAPGEVFSYANPGYVLAGYVLQRATGKPFAEAVRDLLDLQRSTYRPLLAMTYPFAQPHANGGGKVIRPFPDHSGAWPPGSLFSNAEEYSKLVWEHAASLATAAQPADVKTMQVKYGLGVMETSTGALFHTGARSGYGSSFVCLQRTCAVVLTNLTSVTMRSFAEEAVRIASGGSTGRTDTTAPPAAAASPVSPESAAVLAGKFFNSKPIQAELRLRDGVLELRGPGSSQWIRVEQQAGTYLAKGAGPLSRFHITMDPATGKPKFLHAEAWALRYEGAGNQ
jgi:CubicO group peptidase (beta-lactamase class C family)